MWFQAQPKMPFYGDPDYRNAVVGSIKDALGNVPVDVTLFASWGTFEVDIDPEQKEQLARLPLVGPIRWAGDREMLVGPRTVV